MKGNKLKENLSLEKEYVQSILRCVLEGEITLSGDKLNKMEELLKEYREKALRRDVAEFRK